MTHYIFARISALLVKNSCHAGGGAITSQPEEQLNAGAVQVGPQELPGCPPIQNDEAGVVTDRVLSSEIMEEPSEELKQMPEPSDEPIKASSSAGMSVETDLCVPSIPCTSKRKRDATFSLTINDCFNINTTCRVNCQY